MLIIKTPERTYFTSYSSVSIVNFEQVNASWEECYHKMEIFGALLSCYFLMLDG